VACRCVFVCVCLCVCVGGGGGGRKEPANQPFLLVIFPEGTILREASRATGEAYAAKHSLPVPRHMLVPRYTALVSLRAATRGRQMLIRGRQDDGPALLRDDAAGRGASRD
jgi:1-acyl-sn-glycerol-3-phosphate acyltransferase